MDMKFKVQFFKGTKAQYDSISPDRYTFYFLTDTDQVYLGSSELTNTDIASIQTQIARINQELTSVNGNISTINNNVSRINSSVTTINGNISNINSQISGINSNISSVSSDLNTFKQNAVSILTVTQEDKDEIESEISKKDRFYLYVYDDEQKSPDLKIGDGINQIGDLPFLCQTASEGGGTGHGIPEGGTTGQVLVKNSNTDYDAGWQTTSVSTYIHEQGIAASVWNVTHNLNKHPSITVVDTADSIIIGEVQYVNMNSVILTFKAPFKGKAYFN